MSVEVRFTQLKDKLMGLVYDCINKVLQEKKYNKDDAKARCEELSKEINEALQSQKRGFKYICYVTLVEKGDTSLDSCTSCCWNPYTDGCFNYKFESGDLNCNVCLIGISE